MANAICTCEGFDTVAMCAQFWPPSSLLYTSAPSVPRNMILGSLGWNRMDQTTRPSVHVHALPMVAAVGAPVDAPLRAAKDRAGVVGVDGDGPRLGGGRQAHR